jgi:hypothetical protein
MLDPRDLLSIARAVHARSDHSVRRSFLLYAPRPPRASLVEMTTVRIPRID